jgi:hypothetical protein
VISDTEGAGMPEIGQHTKVKISRNLLETKIDDEIVALDVSRGLCYGLDPIGSKIWDMLAEETSAHEICSKLVREFEVSEADCLSDVCKLLNQLKDDDLISVDTPL